MQADEAAKGDFVGPGAQLRLQACRTQGVTGLRRKGSPTPAQNPAPLQNLEEHKGGILGYLLEVGSSRGLVRRWEPELECMTGRAAQPVADGPTHFVGRDHICIQVLGTELVSSG